MICSKIKHLLITIATVVLVGCGESQQSIHNSVSKGNIKGVKQLLASGTDVNAKDSDGYSALHITSGKGFSTMKTNATDYCHNDLHTSFQASIHDSC